MTISARSLLIGPLFLILFAGCSFVMPDYIGEHKLRRQLREGVITKEEYEEELKKLDEGEPATYRNVNIATTPYSRTF